jgi:hypothetical protein
VLEWFEFAFKLFHHFLRTHARQTIVDTAVQTPGAGSWKSSCRASPTRGEGGR